jgi:hypothetical protein
MGSSDWLISVDDHVVEPPHVWTDRLPSKYADVMPRVVTVDGSEQWVYEDKTVYAAAAISATIGLSREQWGMRGLSYAEMAPGCYEPEARIADMNEAGMLASLNFPSVARFCGQWFYEGNDKTLALLCVKAWNDWFVDEWCASAPGRFIPLMLIPLWDIPEAVREVERMAAKGVHALAFSENPAVQDPPGQRRTALPVHAGRTGGGTLSQLRAQGSEGEVVQVVDGLTRGHRPQQQVTVLAHEDGVVDDLRVLLRISAREHALVETVADHVGQEVRQDELGAGVLLGELGLEPPPGEGERTSAPTGLRVLRLAEHAVDPGAELGAGALHFGDPLGQVAGHDVPAFVQNDQEQLVLRSEVPVEDLPPELGGVEDVSDRRVEAAGRGDHLEGGIDEGADLGLTGVPLELGPLHRLLQERPHGCKLPEWRDA